MSPLMFVYLALIAFLFSPGVLVSLPPGGSSRTVAIVHALVISLVWALTHKMVYNLAK